jgi:hypothetical protein
MVVAAPPDLPPVDLRLTMIETRLATQARWNDEATNRIAKLEGAVLGPQAPVVPTLLQSNTPRLPNDTRTFDEAGRPTSTTFSGVRYPLDANGSLMWWAPIPDGATVTRNVKSDGTCTCTVCENGKCTDVNCNCPNQPSALTEVGHKEKGKNADGKLAWKHADGRYEYMGPNGERTGQFYAGYGQAVAQPSFEFMGGGCANGQCGNGSGGSCASGNCGGGKGRRR